ncbi:TetR/AcrR family transcriptional regulator [Budvicia aquatica]|uniref:TetR/AcrR family transcriptional regulator n=2 Tax=Budvicia aquatica TaxID=82979 RepID=A0A2C6C2G9_9GAMM|nr:TetR/AcrR family transcriptional regulator [Budvicia aquatica]PHI30550.1 TetR/AcrR family transcriptional regulator [Budvicia aquatica]
MERDKPVMPLTQLKKRKYKVLIQHALRMFEEGAFPSVTELALEAEVSRATAYRYFPTQSALISTVVDEILKPIIAWEPEQTDAEDRVDELLKFAYPQMFKHEGALRAALLLSLQQWAENRSQEMNAKPGVVVNEKLIRGHRKQILSLVTEPLKDRLSAELREKVIHSLSLVYGSEVFMVFKDIWQLDNDEVQSITQWMAKAILNQAKADTAAEAENRVNKKG